MTIIKIPLGQNGKFEVDEKNDTIIIEVSATILGTPEAGELHFPLSVLINLIAGSITNPILANGFRWIGNLL